jgi:WD40 repeat protein
LQSGGTNELSIAGEPDRVAFGTSDDLLICGTASGTKFISRDGRELFSTSGDARQSNGALSHDRRRLLAFGGASETATLWDVSVPGHAKEITTLLPPGSAIDFAIFSKGDDLIVARNRYGGISLWSGSGEARTFFGAPDTRVETIRFSDDDAHLIAQTNHGAEVWDRYGRALVTLPVSDVQHIVAAENEIAVSHGRSVQVYTLRDPSSEDAQNLRARLAITMK